ncbi:DNA alkylation repair protein [bacterium]|nr:DNA alkylation repair protein [bacterium]
MEFNDIISRFEALEKPEAVKGIAAYGITEEKIYGIPIPTLRSLAKEAGKPDHGLALRLWEHGSRESRILAAMIDNYREVTEAQAETWVRDFSSWEVCDQCILNLFKKTPFAWDKAVEWSSRNEEFVKRAGFALMAILAVGDKKASDSQFEHFFPIIAREATDERNFVKKAVNWALRQIGKRNSHLNKKALETAYRICEIDSKSARWIARDAIRELESEAVRKRLKLPWKRNRIDIPL